MASNAFAAAETLEIAAAGAQIFARRLGSGPPLVLLHGFPQTHLMWRDIAPRLAQRFTVICPDLRGYGRSSCPPSPPDHSPYSKRAMAADIVAMMRQLGFDRFMIAGHDRGGRVAYRLALDHPDAIEAIAVLDVLPVAEVWRHADRKIIGFWPFAMLAQPAPLPERLIAGAPDAIIDDALGGWGSPRETFPTEVREAYIEVLRDAAHVHAICEEYRAAATIDDEHDTADMRAGRRIACPLRALWSGNGPLGSWYAGPGRPAGDLAALGQRRQRQADGRRPFLSRGEAGRNGRGAPALLRRRALTPVRSRLPGPSQARERPFWAICMFAFQLR
jgi:haloacetate dehalogenase